MSNVVFSLLKKNIRCASRLASLLVVLTATLVAQVPQASYGLTANLTDATGTYGPVSLQGTPAPSGPSAGGVCHNGTYINAGGQNIVTPNITTLDPTDGQIDIEFNLTALPTHPFFGGPVIIAGTGQRWMGIEVDAAGFVGMLYNNSNRVWSTVPITPGTWYFASLRFQNGIAQLYINGDRVFDLAKRWVKNWPVADKLCNALCDLILVQQYLRNLGVPYRISINNLDMAVRSLEGNHRAVADLLERVDGATLTPFWMEQVGKDVDRDEARNHFSAKAHVAFSKAIFEDCLEKGILP